MTIFKFFTIIIRYVLLIIIIYLTVSPSLGFTYHDPDQFHKILIINSRRNSQDWRNILIENLIHHFDDRQDKIHILVDNLERQPQHPDREFPDMVKVLGRRYEDYKPDLILFVGDRAARFAVFSKETFFTTSFKLVVGIINDNIEKESVEAGFGGIKVVLPVEKTLDMVIKNHPNVKKIIPIVEARSSRHFFNYISKRLSNLPEKYTRLLAPVYTDWSMEELQRTLEHPEKDAVYLLVQLDYDRDNKPIFLRELESVIDKNNISAYSLFFTYYVGAGAIGMYSFDLEYLKDSIYEDIVRILYTRAPIPPGFDKIDKVRPFVDAKVSTKFGLSVNDYPENTLFINYDSALVQRYYLILQIGTISFALFLVCLGSSVVYTRKLFRRKNEEITKAFKMFSDLSFDGFLTYDSNKDVITHVSPRLAALVHDTPQKMQFNRLRYYTHPDDRDELHIRVENLRHGNLTENFRLRMKLEDNGYHYIEWRGVSQDGIVYATAHDITDLVESQQELTKRNEELSRSNANLEEFAYIISHDLQEPIRTIGTFTDLLMSKIEMTEDMQPIIHFITGGVHQMKSMIEDLLLYSRVNHKSRTSAIILCEIIEKAKSFVQSQFEEIGGTITIERESNPLVIWGDESFLLRVFLNLFSNAGKFRNSNIPLQVDVTIYETSEWGHVKICDNGIGIDPKFHERIFRVFARLNKNIEGTGMGLAIVKRVVEKHGGKVTLTSEKGCGSCFTISLPLYKSKLES